MSDQTVNTTVPSTTSGITYSPTDAWIPVAANGSTNGQSEFLIGDALNGGSNAFITYTFSQPATGFQYWGFQRSDGGLFSICFDCPPTYTLGDRIDALNKSTNGNEPPRLLYSKYDLSYAIHNVTIANLFDSRATIDNSTTGAYGQMSLDRFVLITPATPPTTSSSQASSTAGPTSASSSSPSSSPSAAAAGGNGQSGSSGSNTGAIAGGVVGGVAALVIVALLLWFFFFRKRNQQVNTVDMNAEQGSGSYEPKDGSALEGNPIAPFILGTASAAPQTGYANHAYWPAASSSSGPSAIDPNESGGARPLPAAVAAAAAPRPKGARNMSDAPVVRASDLPVSPSVYPTTSEASGPTSGYATVTPRREQDAGFLAGEEPDTLPPDYDAATARRRAEGL
ncbi:hypothetical protein CALCODRAFT_503006 [Calocera cornea HHB12733]|uniref:Mid2 domain-containing protein n=1 Tax=Calocera cornea HHB12733 TaxID=1353952 RepID=A0A165D1H1_9BASI|nr:hypothetical protein CALCODRAFT_503006 [Calocera cornea HHB12733]